MEKQVIEVAPFRLNARASEQDLLKASAALQESFLKSQPGFIRRHLVKGQDNEWVDVVYWSSHESAKAAMKNASESPVCHQYFQLMVAENHNNPENGVKVYECVSSY
jgi:heme-degrading monooxygenase HmoA